MNSILLDVDTGEDDALALLLALGKRMPLSAVLTSYGNTTLEHATKNTCAILNLSGHLDIPVCYGSRTSLEPHPIESAVSAGDFVGTNGLCDLVLPHCEYPTLIGDNNTFNMDAVMHTIEACAPVDYIVTGPCTNLARLFRAYGNTLKSYLHRIYIMGGAFTVPGNSGPTDPITGAQKAEFNMYCDALAAKEVFACGVPVYCVPWDVTHDCTVSFDQVKRFGSFTAASRFVIDLMHAFFTKYGIVNGRDFEFNDPLTVLAQSGFGQFHEVPVSISTDSVSYGNTEFDPHGTSIYVYSLTQSQKREAITQMISALGLHWDSKVII